MIIGSEVPFKIGERSSAFHPHAGKKVPFLVLRASSREEWLSSEEGWWSEEMKQKNIQDSSKGTWYFYEISVD